jgi:hypothetical protein
MPIGASPCSVGVCRSIAISFEAEVGGMIAEDFVGGILTGTVGVARNAAGALAAARECIEQVLGALSLRSDACLDGLGRKRAHARRSSCPARS